MLSEGFSQPEIWFLGTSQLCIKIEIVTLHRYCQDITFLTIDGEIPSLMVGTLTF